jgi:hypothetical protein
VSDLGNGKRWDDDEGGDYVREVIEAVRDYHIWEREQRIVTLLDGPRMVLRSVVVVGGVAVALPVGSRVVPLDTPPNYVIQVEIQ